MRYDSMDSKTINRKIAKNTILTLMDNITQNSELPMLPAKLVNQFSSELQYKNNKYRILIGIKELFSYRDKNQVLEQNFVAAIISCFHENRHLQQQFAFRQSSCNEEIKFMAHTDLLRISIPECYQGGILANYWNNINEIDAESYGIQKTKQFFQTNFPSIDVDTHIINIIKEKRIWYADTNIKTVDQAIQNLEKQRVAVINRPICLFSKFSQHTYSHSLQTFIQNENRLLAYNTAYNNQDSKQVMNILLDFIKEEHPWKYKEYPCLQDEWTDKIRNAEPPAFAKLRKLDRATQLEAMYENLLDSTQSDFDNTPEYS